MNGDKKGFQDAPDRGVRTLLDRVSREDEVFWSDEDLRAVFGHQWSAPLAVDLAGVDDAYAEQVQSLAVSKGLVLRSFGDLLRHPSPPPALLEMSKEFAKRSLYSPHAAIPQDVARALYFASIAAALGRCGRKITRLSDEEVAGGIRWSLSRDWLGEDARAVLADGLEVLEARGRAEP
jgi:hypothetical protein